MRSSVNYQTIAKVLCVILSLYFVVSGLSPLLDIDSKLQRIGLAATSEDGKVAFILIYSSLMVGIGVAMMLLARIQKSPIASLVLASVILSSFVTFRLVGSFMGGGLTEIQIAYVIIELAEVATVLFVLHKVSGAQHRAA